ncbi:hypothetical protein QE152_g39221 [Popillia japonica]|uniref:Uncharacterized protein n=1 Tax=Popillia japonica TaxID=7064 RepID=A0AAW1HUA7_POPJA
MVGENCERDNTSLAAKKMEIPLRVPDPRPLSSIFVTISGKESCSTESPARWQEEQRLRLASLEGGAGTALETGRLLATFHSEKGGRTIQALPGQDNPSAAVQGEWI